MRGPPSGSSFSTVVLLCLPRQAPVRRRAPPSSNAALRRDLEESWGMINEIAYLCRPGGGLESDCMNRHPEEFSDTDPRAREIWMEILRSKTPGERIRIAFELTDFALQMAESGVRARYPGASE